MNAASFLQALLQHTLLFSAALVLAAGLSALLRRPLGAPAAYLGWLLVPAVLITGALPKPNVEVAATPQAAAAVKAVNAVKAVAVQLDEVMPREAVSAAPDASPRLDRSRLLALAWAGGAASLALLLAWRQHRFSRGLQREPGHAHWTLPAGASPGAIGLWPARLALPQDFEQRFSAAERALILAHEAVHIRRHDNAWNLLAQALLLLNWFNPLAWWALGRMRRDQELSCDAAVLSAADAPEPAAYARALLKSQGDAALPALVSMWRPTHPLIERMSLLAQHRSLAARHPAGKALMLLGIAAAAGAVYAAQAITKLPTAAPAFDVMAAPAQIPPGYKTLKYSIRLQREDGTWEQDSSSRDLKLRVSYYAQRMRFQGADALQPFCAELEAYHFPDDEIRLTGYVLDADCKTALAEPLILPADGRSVRMQGKQADGRPAVIEISARLYDEREARPENAEPAARRATPDDLELPQARPVPDGHNRLQWVFRTRESGGLWRYGRADLDLRNDGRHFSHVLQPSRKPGTEAFFGKGWCLGVQFEHFADNDAALSSRLLDPACKGFGLAPAQAVATDGKTVTRFEGMTDGGYPVTVEFIARMTRGKPSPTDIVNPR